MPRNHPAGRRYGGPYLPLPDSERLVELAARTGRTVGTLIRDAILGHLRAGTAPEHFGDLRKPGDPQKTDSIVTEMSQCSS